MQKKFWMSKNIFLHTDIYFTSMKLCCSSTNSEIPVCACDTVMAKNPELIFTPGKIIQHLCAQNVFFTRAKQSLHTCKSLLHVCKLKLVKRVSFYKLTHSDVSVHIFLLHTPTKWDIQLQLVKQFVNLIVLAI